MFISAFLWNFYIYLSTNTVAFQEKIVCMVDRLDSGEVTCSDGRPKLKSEILVYWDLTLLGLF